MSLKRLTVKLEICEDILTFGAGHPSGRFRNFTVISNASSVSPRPQRWERNDELENGFTSAD